MGMIPAKVAFPVTLVYLEDEEDAETFHSEFELECGLEYFDSRDPEECRENFDVNGRSLVLVIQDLQIQSLEFETDTVSCCLRMSVFRKFWIDRDCSRGPISQGTIGWFCQHWRGRA